MTAFKVGEAGTVQFGGPIQGLLQRLMTGEMGVNQLDLSTLDMQPFTEGARA